MLIAGCGAGGSARGSGGVHDAKPPLNAAESQAVIAVAPGDGAKDVPTGGALAVTVGSGTLTEVVAKSADGVPVPGEVSADARSWHPSGSLALGTQYTVDAYAVDALGRPAAKHAVFTTLVPEHALIGFFSPENGATVGTAMIISLRFSHPVT